MKKPLWFFIGLVVCTILYGVHTSYPRSPKNMELTESYSLGELTERHTYLLSHMTKRNIHPNLRAVHFSIGERFVACGTLVLGRDMKPYCIVTANHIFSDDLPGSDYYDYHILDGNDPSGFSAHGFISKVVLDSVRNTYNPKIIDDIAFCYVGNRSLIMRSSKVRISIDGAYQTAKAPKKITVTSLTTGEKYQIVGEVVGEKNSYFVLEYDSTLGESGSGFLGDDGILYILSAGGFNSESFRQALDIPQRYKVVTLLSAVKINW